MVLYSVKLANFFLFLLKITKTLHMGQCAGKSYTATCLFAPGDFTMRGQKKHINETFSLSLSANPNKSCGVWPTKAANFGKIGNNYLYFTFEVKTFTRKYSNTSMMTTFYNLHPTSILIIFANYMHCSLKLFLPSFLLMSTKYRYR